MKKIFGKPRGQVAVLYAGVVAVLLGAVALTTDVAVMYVNWQQAQKVADAAAIAGANYLPSTNQTFAGTIAAGCTGDAAEKVACTYAVNNGLPIADLTPAITDTATTVTVSATEAGLPYFFAQALGMGTYSVEASATASIQAVGNSPIFPMGLQCGAGCTPSSLIAGEPLTFGAKFVGGLAPGNWQWLDPNSGPGGGTHSLDQAIQGNLPTIFSVGGDVTSEPGNAAGSNPNVATDFTNRFNTQKCGSTDPCTQPPPPIDPSNPCLVVMPIVNYAGCTGSCTMAIQGFAQVYIEPGSTTASVNGCFISQYDPNASGSSTAQNFGPLSPPVLTQ